MNCYIVLFDDGCLQIYNKKPNPEHFRSDARIWECDDDTTIIDISEWVGAGYRYTRKIKEIR
jgi:hypothetical protein